VNNINVANTVATTGKFNFLVSDNSDIRYAQVGSDITFTYTGNSKEVKYYNPVTRETSNVFTIVDSYYNTEYVEYTAASKTALDNARANTVYEWSSANSYTSGTVVSRNKVYWTANGDISASAEFVTNSSSANSWTETLVRENIWTIEIAEPLNIDILDSSNPVMRANVQIVSEFTITNVTQNASNIVVTLANTVQINNIDPETGDVFEPISIGTFPTTIVADSASDSFSTASILRRVVDLPLSIETTGVAEFLNQQIR